MCVYVCMCVRVYVSVFVRVYVRVCVCVCMCVRLCLRIPLELGATTGRAILYVIWSNYFLTNQNAYQNITAQQANQNAWIVFFMRVLIGPKQMVFGHLIKKLDTPG